MIDLLVQTIQSGLLQELGKDSTYYADHFIADTTNKALGVATPNGIISVEEDSSRPVDYMIASRHSHTSEEYSIKIRIMHRGMKEEDVKSMRRLALKRMRMAFMRGSGNLFTSILTLVDSGVDYRETVKQYKLGTSNYGNTEYQNQYYYASETDLTVLTDTNFSAI